MTFITRLLRRLWRWLDNATYLRDRSPDGLTRDIQWRTQDATAPALDSSTSNGTLVCLIDVFPDALAFHIHDVLNDTLGEHVP